jgi:hypothetical protein
MATARADDRFRLDAFEPAYLALHREGRLRARAEEARRALERLDERAGGRA